MIARVFFPVKIELPGDVRHGAEKRRIRLAEEQLRRFPEPSGT